MTGLLVVPLFLVAGLAVDYTRAISVRQHLQAAADAAALAAKGSPDDASAAALSAANAYATANTSKLNGAVLGEVIVAPTSGGFEVSLTATLPTTLARAVGIDDWDVSTTSESVRASDNIEIALVLDNTGSMVNDMDDLRLGATDLVDAVFGGKTISDKVKIAIVPYVGAVNVGNGPHITPYMDLTGQNNWNGHGLSYRSFGYEPGCVFTPWGGPAIDPGFGQHGSLETDAGSFASLLQSIIGIAPASAATAADVPSPHVFGPDCWINNPKINFFDLFQQMSNTTWKGCVMAREDWNDRDVSDEIPNPADPNSLFVPWFWPDTIDPDAVANSGDPSTESRNDYVRDRLDLRDAVAPKFNDAWVGWTHWDVLKYNNAVATIDESGPDTTGPNKSCPDPVLPLTNVKSAVTDKISQLTHWNDSGTNIAEGISWGMRVLTPAPPFTEGSADQKTKKVMVVMTDGINNVDPTNDTSILSDWSAWGYLANGRVTPPTYDGFRAYVNQRMVRACEIAKSKNIEIYTVTFGAADATTRQLLQDCASRPPYAYSASSAQDMVAAFRSIGQSLTELRLSK
ncbi:MAG: VWA domain-containing protein [Hyphomicrobiaceae bacterium]|nr:VWA domain-containing protein [Hyphomicrobiaceae bacterium]